PRRGLRRAFSLGDHAQPIVLRFSCQGDPLQLIEQGGELRRTKTAGGLSGQRGADRSVLPDHGKCRRARWTFESHAPVRSVLSPFFRVEKKGEICIAGDRDSIIPQERKGNFL